MSHIVAVCKETERRTTVVCFVAMNTSHADSFFFIMYSKQG